jgi:hypothetical protein
LKTQLEARREQLKQERDRFQAVYKPKVAAALRSKHSGTTDRHQSPERHEKNSPRCVTPPKADGENTSAALRGRLRVSFAQISATHAYGTLFPALLTPYERACLIAPPKEKKENGHDTEQVASAGSHSINETNRLSVVSNERRRVQPVSGPRAFFPTGSNICAYRHFTHIPHGGHGTFSLSK